MPTITGKHVPMPRDPQMGSYCALCKDGCWGGARCDCCAMQERLDERRLSWVGGALVGLIIGFLLGLMVTIGRLGC